MDTLAGRAPADAVVVAAGGSRRMRGIDKLMFPIGGRPLLAWTLAALAASPVIDQIVLVAAADRVERLASAPWLPAKVAAVIAGGPTRQLSVAAGVGHLDRIDPDGRDRPMLVHDGARPLVSPGLVEAVASAVGRYGAAIPVLSMRETVKRVGEGLVHETLDRTMLATAQTPQGARRGLLLEAWRTFPPDGPPEFTDEAALLEACKIPVHAIPGDAANLKVTVPDDLHPVGRALTARAPRIGFGHDSHPFGPGRPLRLGGIELSEAPALAGHSDGDVVLHAIADALLGAAALGDLGRMFPPDASTPAGVASADLLAGVVARVRGAGLRVASVDVVVIGARPRLGSRLDGMRAAIAEAMDVEVDSVNVKASTGNLAGDEGAGRSISARAVAVLVDAP